MSQHTTPGQPNPSQIMQIGTGFWASKILLSAVRFELFTHFSGGPLSGAEIRARLGLRCSDHHLYDFLDTLAGFGFLTRKGLLETAKYANGLDANIFLDKKKPSYVGGMLEMLNSRLYKFWGNLEEGLLTGEPQNEVKHGDPNPFEEFYKTEEKTREFVNAMSGIQMGNFMVFAQKFDFSKYKTLCDVGGAGSALCIQVALNQPHIACTNFDLPPVENIAKGNIAHFGLSDRIKTVNGNFFTDSLPQADIIVMGNILHDWNEAKKLELMRKAYDALPDGGVFVAIEGIIDPDRRENLFGLMMSLNMLIETGDGFDYTQTSFRGWAEKAGFKKVEFMPLAGPFTAGIAYK